MITTVCIKVHFGTDIWKWFCLAPVTTHSLRIPYHQVSIFPNTLEKVIQ